MTTQPFSGPQSESATEERPEPRAKPRAAATARRSSSDLAGMLWFAGWLFTISFAKLVWWKALLALIVWPYFLGLALR